MLAKKIKYEDYNGEEKEKTFYFNLSKTDCIKLEMTSGGLEKKVKTIMDNNDGAAMFELFTNVILMAYGERDEDGERFIKSPKLSEAFSQTPAYDILFMEIISSPENATNFIRACLPKDMQQVETPATIALNK